MIRKLNGWFELLIRKFLIVSGIRELAVEIDKKKSSDERTYLLRPRDILYGIETKLEIGI